MHTTEEVQSALLSAIVNNARKAGGEASMLTPTGALEHAQAARELTEALQSFGWNPAERDQS